MRYSPSTGKAWRIARPPRDPNGRSSLCRSSCIDVQRNLERLEPRRSSAAGPSPAASPGAPPTGSVRGAPSKSRAHPRSCRSCRPPSRRRAAAASRRARSSANRSRIALLYSARLRRWTALIRPGFGCAAHARSISRLQPARHRADRSPRRAAAVRPAASSRPEASRSRAPRLRRWRRAGRRRGCRARGRRCVSRWLWHVTQHASRTALGRGRRGRASRRRLRLRAAVTHAGQVEAPMNRAWASARLADAALVTRSFCRCFVAPAGLGMPEIQHK